jgi:hypothetical protein
MLAVAVADQLATVGGHNFNEAQEIGAIVAAQLEHTDKSSEPGCLSFKDLADVLSAQKSVPSLAQLDELIDRTKIGAEEAQPYLGFKAGNYSRHRVMKNEFVEMLVLGLLLISGLEATDRRLTGAGSVALWSKADSVTEFTDLAIEAAR